MTVLRSYGQAYVVNGTALTVHIEVNGGGTSLCGRGPVKLIGSRGAPDTEGWHRCAMCWSIAGPPTTSIWDT
jgi:hypothetical protein